MKKHEKKIPSNYAYDRNVKLCFKLIATFDALQELQSEMEKHKAHLKQLKDYNEKLSQERKDRALREKEMQRILVNMHVLYTMFKNLTVL